ncbi:MAG: ATP-binding protein [Chloroflexota bacterium]
MNVEYRSTLNQSALSSQDRLQEFLLSYADHQLKKIGPTALWIGTAILLLVNLRRIANGDWLGVTLSIISLCLGWYIVKSNALTSHARISIFVIMCVLVGLANLLTHGLIENGRIVLFYACVGVTSANRWHYSLITFITSCLSIFTTGILLYFNVLDPILIVDHPPVTINDIVSFTLYFAIFAGVSQFWIHEIFRRLVLTWEKQDKSQTELRRQNNLIKTLAEQRAIELEELKKSKKELDLYKKDLEKMVKQRTIELNIERDRAKAANQAKSAFMTNMSHELRTPLNTIIGYSQLISEELGGNVIEDQELIGDILRIEKSGQHLLKMINNLLDLSKIEANKVSITLEEFELNSFLDDIELHVWPLSRLNQNKFKIINSSQNYKFTTDGQKVKQILINLIGNAFKFTKSGLVTLEVSVCITEAPNIIKFDVIDSGQGISAEFLASIFDPFSQENFSLSRSEGGSGLGLAISKKYAELLGGSIEVSSELGSGSRFSLFLPIKSEQNL